MKCRNCGATSSGITCPVCGHRQLKKAECSVCFTTLFPGQEYCPKCGSPTVYRKTDNVKRITPDTIVHSYDSHNYDTVSESYDYKKDAYDYNEDDKKPNIMTFASIFEPLKSNKYSYHRYQRPIKTSKKRVVPVSIIVLSIFIIICTVSTVVFVENVSLDHGIETIFNDDEDMEGNVEFNDFVLNRDTTQSEYNYYVNGDGLSFVYNNQLYIADDDGIMVYQPNEEPFLLIDDIDCCYLYVNDDGVYYKNIENRYIVDNGDEREVLLENVDKCYQLGQDIIYLDHNGQLTHYNIDTKSKTPLFQNAYDFIVDDVNRRIIVSDNDIHTTLIDFSGQILKENVMDLSYDDYFSNGYLYFRYFEAISRKDVMNEEVETILENENYYTFVLTKKDEQNILYGKTDNDVLETWDDEDNDFTHIHNDVEKFYPVGDKVVFYIYDSDYSRIFYIADMNGNYARLE